VRWLRSIWLDVRLRCDPLAIAVFLLYVLACAVVFVAYGLN
jgi:hypothetical protein